MKSAIVYFSRTGNVKRAASKMAEITQGDLKEIVCLENTNGVFGFIKCGFQAAKRKEARIAQIFDDMNDYDLVIVCSPIWAGNMSSPVRAFLNKYGSSLQNVAFLVMHGDGKNNYREAIREMSKICGKTQVAYLSLAQNKDSDFGEELFEFAKKIADHL